MPAIVVRECKVCEWKGAVKQNGSAVVDCPWCHGPTAAGKNPDAAALGRLGGLKGGPARAATLSARRRRAIAAKAARARWTKVRKSKG